MFASEGGEETAGGVAALGIDLKSFLLQLATFLLVFFVLKKYAFAPILKALEDRRLTIEEGLKTAKELEEQSEKAAVEHEKMLARSRAEADKVIVQAKTEAAVLVKAAEEKAAARGEQLVKEARVHIEEDVKAAKRALKQETIDLVIGATQSIIEEKLDVRRDHRLIEKALSKGAHHE